MNIPWLAAGESVLVQWPAEVEFDELDIDAATRLLRLDVKTWMRTMRGVQ